MANKDNKRGFSGLSDLASKVSGIDESVSSEPKSEAKPSSSTQTPPSTPRETTRGKPERKSTTSPPPIETVSNGKSGGGSGGKWILGIIAIVFVIWLANYGGQSNKKPSYNPPSPSSSYNYPQNSPTPAVKSPNNRLSVQQTREAQQLLTDLGYDPGPIDGQYGRRTAGAVKAFQEDVGLSQDEWIDQNLLNSLTETKALNNHPAPRSHNDRSDQRALAQEIESGKAQAKQMEIQIKNMDHRLEDYERKIRSYRASGMMDEYNLLVPAFNSLVSERNDLYEKYSNLIAEVNAKVNRFNSSYR
jgi:hypothetical protein